MKPEFKNLILTLWLCLLASSHAIANVELRVCADPDNLPFSNQEQQGFENKIAAVLAEDMHATLSYTWMKQRQNFFRQTLGAQRCDLVIGVPKDFGRVLTTQPYYRSSYVLVTQNSRNLKIKSYDDPILRGLKIGVHAIGNDGSNSPPAVALGRHGLAKNIIGFSMWGVGSIKNPQGQVVAAVAKGEIDAAIVWGPFGGYFASQYGDSLTIVPAPTDLSMPEMLFAYDISMGVRKGETEFVEKLEKSIKRNQDKIDKILLDYHIPVSHSDVSKTQLISGSVELSSKKG